MNRVAATVVVLLVATAVWLGAAVMRLENYRYASAIGMCSKFDVADPMQRNQREICLEQTQTRTNVFWHLLYGLKIM
jgi:hypothetical protein